MKNSTFTKSFPQPHNREVDFERAEKFFVNPQNCRAHFAPLLCGQRWAFLFFGFGFH
jgi:hypothetical protein